MPHQVKHYKMHLCLSRYHWPNAHMGFTLVGITVNALAPAVVRTGMVEAMNPAQVKYMTDKIPMQRSGDTIKTQTNPLSSRNQVLYFG